MKRATTILTILAFVILGIRFFQNSYPQTAQAASSRTTNNQLPDSLTSTEWESVQTKIAANASANTLWLQQAKLTASDGVAQDQFSYSVAISGDTIVVGAYADDGLTGIVYVFIKSGGDWSSITQAAKLTASDGAMGDRFGVSVDINDDTIVVGADFDDDNGDDSGSAYIFIKPLGNWSDMTQTAKLIASDGATFDGFGGSVSIEGDTVVVGAWQDDDSGMESGSAYVFVKPVSGWNNATQTAKLTASDGAANDEFGRYSVAVSGDTVVVGAYRDDDKGTSSGSAYVFVRPGGNWSDMTQTAKLTASDGAAFDWFGDSVAVSDDTVVVGAPLNNDNGSAYIFVKPSGGWIDMTQAAKLNAADGAAGDTFGGAVAINVEMVVIGASGDDGSFFNSGSAYVFIKPGSGWNNMAQATKLTATDGAVSDLFGNSVDISNDTIVIGAYLDDDNGTDSGSAYIFSKAIQVYLPIVIGD